MVTGLICVRYTGDPSVHEHRLRLSDVILGAGAGVADRDNHFDSTVIASRSDRQSARDGAVISGDKQPLGFR
jgi:hypothetical protein